MAPLPLPLLHPSTDHRKHRPIRQRAALLALFALFAFSCYLLFVAYPSINFSKPLLAPVPDPARLPDAHHIPPHRHLRPVPPSHPPLALDPHEELAALSAFIAALPHNVLPSSVDPNAPLDPQLVLDFDPRGDTAREELDRLVDQVWARFPVILYTKLHSADSRELRVMLANMHLRPAPLVVEVDQREDAQVLQPLLARLTDVPSLPLLLIGGQAVGSGASDTKSVMSEIRRLHESGELARRVLEAGSAVEHSRKKGKGKKRRSD